MRKAWVLIIVLMAAAFAFCGCFSNDAVRIEAVEGANPWTHLDFRNDPQDFQFVILADRTGGERPGVFEDAVNKVNLMQPEFVMCVGDLIEGYTEDRGIASQQWEQLDALVRKLEMPFFYLPGNHDYSNPVMARVWEHRLGRSYYHFVYRDCLFLCLNTVDERSTGLSREQIDYFKGVIDSNKKVRWTLVFMHHPIWLGDADETWREFAKLLGGRQYTVFAGHIHIYTKRIENGMEYYTLATTGGSRMEEDECRFDHFLFVTMTDKGPAIANVLLEGIKDPDTCLVE